VVNPNSARAGAGMGNIAEQPMPGAGTAPAKGISRAAQPSARSGDERACANLEKRALTAQQPDSPETCRRP
jgi:hypothetical protein